MTPLAHKLAKFLIDRKARKGTFWEDNSSRLRSALDDIHCFEVTEIVPHLPQMIAALRQDTSKASSVFETYSFLPAPKTWIEYKNPICGRLGYLLCEDKERQVARVDLLFDKGATHLGEISLCSSNISSAGGVYLLPPAFRQRYSDADGPMLIDSLLAAPQFFLLFVNSPKIIGRRQRMPHAGLERRLTRALGYGSFPLHAWHEIKLEVAKPVEIDDGKPHEAHLTGARALHFCRAHLRVKQGRLEYVSSHWRGDPAVGVKRARYRLTAPPSFSMAGLTPTPHEITS
jgi:hypothetical protein